MIALLAAVPVIAEFLLYKRNPASRVIKHVVGCTYALFYVIIVATTTNEFAFVYAMPMFVVVTLYSDFWYSMALGIGAVLVNLIFVFINHPNGITVEETAKVEIQIAVILLVGVYSAFSSKILKSISEQKMQALDKEKEGIRNLLETVMRISEDMTVTITDINTQMDQLGDAVNETCSAMKEVSTGTNDAAESVQTQLVRTEEIQNHIEEATSMTEAIKDSMETAEKSIHAGKENVDELTKLVESSEKASTQVIEQLDALNEQTEKMQTIMEEVSAHATETFSTSEKNEDIVKQVGEQVTLLKDKAAELLDTKQ